MGTLIKMKAEVTNTTLPVLTDIGPKDYYVGNFYNRCKEAGTELTSGQVTAIETFIQSLRDNDIIDNVATMYPLFGNSTNPSTVGIPLIGDAPLVYASGYNNYLVDSGNIVGPKSIPSQTSNIGNGKNGLTLAVSLYITSISDIQTSLYSLLRTKLNSGKTYNYRLDGSTTIKNKLYEYDENSQSIGNVIPSTSLTEQDLLGNVYTMLGLGDENSEFTYGINFLSNGTYKYSDAGYASVYKAVAENSPFTIIGSDASSGIVYTGVTLFYKVMSSAKSKLFLNALQALNNAFGKEPIA